MRGKQQDVGPRLQAAEIALLRTDEHERHVRQAPRDLDEQILIDPLVHPADVTGDRPRQRRDVCGRRWCRLPRRIEGLEANPERKEVHRGGMLSGSCPQLLGRHEHEIGAAKHRVFARRDAPRVR